MDLPYPYFRGGCAHGSASDNFQGFRHRGTDAPWEEGSRPGYRNSGVPGHRFGTGTGMKLGLFHLHPLLQYPLFTLLYPFSSILTPVLVATLSNGRIPVVHGRGLSWAAR